MHELSKQGQLWQYAKDFAPAELGHYQEQLHLIKGDSTAVIALVGGFLEDINIMIQRDEQLRDVQKLCEQMNGLLVSAIGPYSSLGPFRHFRNPQVFQEFRLYDVLLRPQQIVAASFISEGDDYLKLYKRFGFILGGGRVLEAAPYDAQTYVKNGTIISKTASRTKGMCFHEKVKTSIFPGGEYNELNTAMTHIAGVMYCIEEPSDVVLGEDRPDQQIILQIANHYNIPCYTVNQGKFYLVENGQTFHEAAQDEPVSVTEVLAKSVNLEPEQKNELIQKGIDTLRVSPRNEISSGLFRGKSAYEYRKKKNTAPLVEHTRYFVAQHENMFRTAESDNLRLYAAITIYSYALTAQENGDDKGFRYAIDIAQSLLPHDDFAHLTSLVTEKGDLRITESMYLYYLENGVLPPYHSF